MDEQIDKSENQLPANAETASEQTPELPSWWRLDDKIPSERCEVAPSNTGAFIRTVYCKDAKLYNIIALAFLVIVLVTIVIGFFAPVFALNDTCDESAVIREFESGGMSDVHYIAVKQSGLKLIKGAFAMFERNDNKAQRLKYEHDETLMAIQSEYMLWGVNNLGADDKEARRAYEKIFVKHMSKTDFAGYLATLPFADKGQNNLDVSEMIKAVMPVAMIGLFYLVGALASVIPVIVNATKAVTELSNKSDKVLFWNQTALLFTYSLPLYLVNVGNPVTTAYLLSPVFLHILLSFIIGLHYAKKRKQLTVPLIFKSIVSPILVMTGLGLAFGNSAVSIKSDVGSYGDSIFAPLVKIIENAVRGEFDYKWIIIVFAVFLAVMIVIAVFQQRSNKKRAAYGIEPIYYSVSCSYSRIVIACFVIACAVMLIGACTNTVKFSFSVWQYVATVLCAVSLITELVIKGIDQRKRIKAAKALQIDKCA